jgi:hypothetical protein
VPGAGFGARLLLRRGETNVQTTRLLATVSGVLTLLAAAGSVADEAPAKSEAPAPAPVAAEVVSLGAQETALTTDALGAERAKAKIDLEELTINAAENHGAVAGNISIGDNDSRNAIDGDAFRDASGFMNAIQNTGNNVLIQNATIINVSVEQ